MQSVSKPKQTGWSWSSPRYEELFERLLLRNLKRRTKRNRDRKTFDFFEKQSSGSFFQTVNFLISVFKFFKSITF